MPSRREWDDWTSLLFNEGHVAAEATRKGIGSKMLIILTDPSRGYGVIIHHDNARYHVANITKHAHPRYSTDFIFSD